LGFGVWGFSTGCGKKGPPLLPFVRQPAAAEVTSALRVGDDVYVTVSVPTANVDGSAPASVKEIEVWAATAATAPSPSQLTAIGTNLVTRIPVARYADPADRSGTVVPDATTGALQGASVTIRDSLTDDEMKVRQLPASAKARAGTPAATTADRETGSSAPAPEAPRRFYMTIPVSDRKRPGPPSKLVDVPLTSVPGGVTSLSARMEGRKVVVEWQPSGGLFGFLVGRALPLEPSPLGEPAATDGAKATVAAVSGPVLYNVYRELSPDPLALPVREAAADSRWASNPELPANPQPLTMLRFEEEVPFDERRRCYYVRAVRGTGAQRVESQSSSRACVIPVDTEAPAAVTSLTATVVEGEIILRWDPNGEEDLRGYVVLRRAPGDDTLQQLTTPPIARTTFTDLEVTAGQMYTYVVHAVDNRIPVPNVSDPAEATATAR
jgi:hypothetical protein